MKLFLETVAMVFAGPMVGYGMQPPSTFAGWIGMGGFLILVAIIISRGPNVASTRAKT